MSSLYRRYRPQTFDDVLGQDHICSSLTTSLKKNLVGHAYLFSGPRGTGKTTLARLFARAINCTKRPQNQNPCNSCEVCTEIADGRSVDVFEIDAASNRGIDEIRELRDRIAFSPSRAKYKIYIIDEVHMLTKEAFNALLKTLEEPPSHALFILATTELHKVPETIISRCQRYQFHRAAPEAMSNLLTKVAKKEKIIIDSPGVEALVHRADGSYRDALTLLGNIASHEGSLDGDTVRKLLGLPPHQVITEMIKALNEGNSDEVVTAARSFIQEGGDIGVLIKSISDVCKREILALTGTMTVNDATRLLESLLLVQSRARYSSDPTALILAQLITLSKNHSSTRSTTVQIAVPPPAMRDVQKVDKPKDDTPASVDAVATPKPTHQPPADSGGFWSQFLEGVKAHNHALYMVIRSAQLEGLTDDTVLIAVKFRFYVDRLQEVRNKKLIETVATDVAGRTLRLECVIRSDIDLGVPTDDDMVPTVVEVFELEEAKS